MRLVFRNGNLILVLGRINVLITLQTEQVLVGVNRAEGVGTEGTTYRGVVLWIWPVAIRVSWV